MATTASGAQALPASTRTSEALRQLRNGEIAIDQYLDVHADSAVDHLRKLLPAEQLKIVRETIREQLTTDPVVAEMIRRATGHDLERTGTR